MEKLSNDFTLSKDTYIECDSDSLNYGTVHKFVLKDASNGDSISEVSFQKGPVKEFGLNGVQDVDLLLMVEERLRRTQESKYAVIQCANALQHVREAIVWLNARTAAREKRKVEGTSTV